jgi:hypothetical protein
MADFCSKLDSRQTTNYLTDFQLDLADQLEFARSQFENGWGLGHLRPCFLYKKKSTKYFSKFFSFLRSNFKKKSIF